MKCWLICGSRSRHCLTAPLGSRRDASITSSGTEVFGVTVTASGAPATDSSTPPKECAPLAPPTPLTPFTPVSPFTPSTDSFPPSKGSNVPPKLSEVITTVWGPLS